MLKLRHNKFASLLLALAVFFTAMSAPALAAVCEYPVEPQTPAAGAPRAAAGMPCAKSEKRACCCEPKDHHGASAAHRPEHSEAGAQIQAEQCHCSMSPAPDANPADTKVARPVPVEVAYLPPTPFQIELPVQLPWAFAAPTGGPPGGPERASAPSRAPPACL